MSIEESPPPDFSADQLHIRIGMQTLARRLHEFAEEVHMKWICAVCVAAAAVACGGASESHNSSQAGGAARAGIADPANQPKVTLNGCLQNADRAETAGTTGTAGRGSSGGAADQMAAGKGSPGERFTLTNATSSSGASDPSAGSYILEGNLEALRGSVNRHVRLTGTLDATAANTAGPQRVRVDSVEPVGERCTER